MPDDRFLLKKIYHDNAIEMMECSLPSPPPTPPRLMEGPPRDESSPGGLSMSSSNGGLVVDVNNKTPPGTALDGNRNELPTEEDLQLLAKMREANR